MAADERAIESLEYATVGAVAAAAAFVVAAGPMLLRYPCCCNGTFPGRRLLPWFLVRMHGCILRLPHRNSTALSWQFGW